MSMDLPPDDGLHRVSTCLRCQNNDPLCWRCGSHVIAEFQVTELDALREQLAAAEDVIDWARAVLVPTCALRRGETYEQFHGALAAYDALAPKEKQDG